MCSVEISKLAAKAKNKLRVSEEGGFEIHFPSHVELLGFELRHLVVTETFEVSYAFHVYFQDADGDDLDEWYILGSHEVGVNILERCVKVLKEFLDLEGTPVVSKMQKRNYYTGSYNGLKYRLKEHKNFSIIIKI